MPSDGSGGRKISVEVTDTVGISEKIEAKGKPGRKKPGKRKRSSYYEYKEYLELNRATGRMSKVQRGINRDTNEYHEIITDAETGELIRECKQPLTDHQDRGSAKRE